MRPVLEQVGQCTSIAIQVCQVATGTVNRQEGENRQCGNNPPNPFITLYVMKNILHGVWLLVICYWVIWLFGFWLLVTNY